MWGGVSAFLEDGARGGAADEAEGLGKGVEVCEVDAAKGDEEQDEHAAETAQDSEGHLGSEERVADGERVVREGPARDCRRLSLSLSLSLSSYLVGLGSRAFGRRWAGGEGSCWARSGRCRPV